MADTKKYVVAKGCAFTGNKKSYKEGEAIDASAFAGENGAERFKVFIKTGKIIEGVPGDGTENNNYDGNDDNIETSLTRAEMETLALELNIEPEAIAKFNDAKLKKVLKKAGKLN